MFQIIKNVLNLVIRNQPSRNRTTTALFLPLCKDDLEPTVWMHHQWNFDLEELLDFSIEIYITGNSFKKKMLRSLSLKNNR